MKFVLFSFRLLTTIYFENNSNNTFTQNNYITTSKEITQDMAKVLPLMMSKEINKLSIDRATLQINTAY